MEYQQAPGPGASQRSTGTALPGRTAPGSLFVRRVRPQTLEQPARGPVPPLAGISCRIGPAKRTIMRTLKDPSNTAEA